MCSGRSARPPVAIEGLRAMIYDRSRNAPRPALGLPWPRRTGGPIGATSGSFAAPGSGGSLQPRYISLYKDLRYGFRC